MNLDVEVSMANKLLAYEKVLTRSESRRRGAKPVVRNNHTFPCLTVHNPSDLNPMFAPPPSHSSVLLAYVSKLEGSLINFAQEPCLGAIPKAIFNG